MIDYNLRLKLEEKGITSLIWMPIYKKSDNLRSNVIFLMLFLLMDLLRKGGELGLVAEPHGGFVIVCGLKYIGSKEFLKSRDIYIYIYYFRIYCSLFFSLALICFLSSPKLQF